MIKKRILVSEIIGYLGPAVYRVDGFCEDMYIDNLSSAKEVSSTTLDWINPNKKEQAQSIAESTVAKTIIVGNGVVYNESIKNQGKCLITVSNPKLAIAKIGNEFFLRKVEPTIHPTAIISSGAKIGSNIYIGPYAVIGDAVIGDNCIISSNVRIYDDVVVGNNCIIKEGAVIGGAGFGFEIDEEGNHFRFPQLGGVHIGNHVDIGANTCIDRGALSDTIIGDYVKIDNLVHIAHNVQIGNNAMIIACSEVSGSCVIEENTWVGPNTSIREWQHIESNSLIGIGSVVVKNIPSGEVWAGNPAKRLK